MFKLKPLVATERQEHLALMQWVRLQPWRDYWIHIPNEGKRDRISGYILKNMGLTKGVADFFLAMPVGRIGGLWLELKRVEGSRTSPEQIAWLERMAAVGYAACIAYGCDDAIRIIKDYVNGEQVL